MQLVDVYVHFDNTDALVNVLIIDQNPLSMLSLAKIHFVFNNVKLAGCAYDGEEPTFAIDTVILKTSLSNDKKQLNAQNLTYHLSESHTFLTFDANIKTVLPEMKKQIEAKYDKNALLELVAVTAKKRIEDKRKFLLDSLQHCNNSMELLSSICASE